MSSSSADLFYLSPLGSFWCWLSLVCTPMWSASMNTVVFVSFTCPHPQPHGWLQWPLPWAREPHGALLIYNHQQEAKLSNNIHPHHQSVPLNATCSPSISFSNLSNPLGTFTPHTRWPHPALGEKSWSDKPCAASSASEEINTKWPPDSSPPFAYIPSSYFSALWRKSGPASL